MVSLFLLGISPVLMLIYINSFTLKNKKAVS